MDAPSLRQRVDLSGTWECRPLAADEDPLRAQGGWRPIPVPCNWHLAGLEGYAGAVAFRRSFPAQARQGRLAHLLFQGVDYYADVWLNGVYLGHHQGYFQPFGFDVTGLLRPHNELLVRVEAPREEPRAVWPNRKRLIKGVFQHHDCRPGSWSLEHGQDAPTGGIWGRVELLYTAPVHLRWLRLAPLRAREGSAQVLATASISSPDRREVEATLELRPLSGGGGSARQSLRVVLQGGENELAFSLTVPEPALWWTWDHGSPELYVATLTLTGVEGTLDALQERCGLREVRIDDDWTWHLNGRPFFPRGTNIIPAEWLSAYTPEAIAGDVRLLREANVNAVRVHAHVNRRELYQALDEAGIVVWQDFALQWGYEDSDEFVQEAVRQAREMVRHLYNHPCIVLWCCHNEPLPHNRGRLGPALAAALRAEDPTRRVEEASDFRHHPYPGWYYGSYREFSGLPGAPLPTEFGAQALPDVESLRQMLPPQSLWPPDWDAWAYHCFQYHETFHLAGLPLGGSLEELVEASQDYQARLLKYAIEHYRRAKGRIKGLFQFMFMDPAPLITWSVVDYYRRPKRGYHALRDAYQPVLPVIGLEREKSTPGRLLAFPVAVVNDLPCPFPGAKVRIWAQGPDGWQADLDSYALDIPADGVALAQRPPLEAGLTVWRVPPDAPTGRYTLWAEVRDAQGGLLGRNWQALELVALPLGREWWPFF